ncbi:IS66 family transposase [Rhizobium beringeri]
MGRPRIGSACAARLCYQAHIAALDRIHTDDTPVDVLDPGRGKTKTGRVWVYVFDGSGYRAATPVPSLITIALTAGGMHPADHLANFSGVMHADGYGGYKKLYGNQIVEAACMAHYQEHGFIWGRTISMSLIGRKRLSSSR